MLQAGLGARLTTLEGFKFILDILHYHIVKLELIVLISIAIYSFHRSECRSDRQIAWIYMTHNPRVSDIL
jgi:hypothetical protein